LKVQWLELLDWKRRVFELYAYVREAAPEDGWQAWRDERDHLFATHPQTPNRDAALRYFDYDPAARVLGEVVAAPSEELRLPVSRDEEIVAERVGRVRFVLYGSDAELDLFWIGGYGGGLFLPFRDTTSGTTTYGAGRYLLDTVKGADLGTNETGALVLDFNFAYNPSCAYDPRWACPLAPPANRLGVAVEAGERTA
jgi:uncharacterized protein (DUF1684 family)